MPEEAFKLVFLPGDMFLHYLFKNSALNLVQRLNRYLIEYNFFIACCALALLGYFSLLMRYPFPAEIYIFTFFSTISTYNLFRGYPTFKAYLKDAGSVRFNLVLYGFVISGCCFFLLPDEIKLFYVALGIFTLMYKFNVLGKFNLRSIPYLKLPVIALVWVCTGSIYLLINLHHLPDMARVSGVLVMQFFFFIAITIPFDVFGLIEDDMPTIPSRFGVRGSLLISKIFLALYFVVALCIYQRPVFLLASGIVAVVSAIAVHFSPLFERKMTQYYLVDGTIIFQTLIFYLCLYR